jgi:hypothetical protein
MFKSFDTEAARAPAVSAELIGSETAVATGITARGPSPVLELCRLLVAADIDPGRPLHAYRGNVLCLIVRSIGAGAALTVKERPFGPTFERWTPFPTPLVKPPIAPMPATAVAVASRKIPDCPRRA